MCLCSICVLCIYFNPRISVLLISGFSLMTFILFSGIFRFTSTILVCIFYLPWFVFNSSILCCYCLFLKASLSCLHGTLLSRFFVLSFDLSSCSSVPLSSSPLNLAITIGLDLDTCLSIQNAVTFPHGFSSFLDVSWTCH